jgi:hypothetical protein
MTLKSTANRTRLGTRWCSGAGTELGAHRLLRPVFVHAESITYAQEQLSSQLQLYLYAHVVEMDPWCETKLLQLLVHDLGQPITTYAVRARGGLKLAVRARATFAVGLRTAQHELLPWR